MKTVFDKTTRDELIYRINTLSENSVAEWSKMNIYQMIKHCTLWEEWISDNQNNKQALIGRLFGRMALKNILKDEKPLRRNTPTLREFRIKEKDGDVTSERTKWIALIKAYEQFSKQE